jgi:CDP-diacylglycerol--glycerol-3-phosphate 3-phosphatidyltransferase
MLALTLLALVGSFMVSYGSAKAEALHVAVPHGSMRRAERATYFGTGIALAPIVAAFSRRFGGPLWAGNVPLVLAVTLIGVTANVSAARRLRDIAAAVSTYGSLPRSAAPAREPVKTRVVGADAE